MQNYILERTALELVLICLVFILGVIVWNLLVKYWLLRCLLAKQLDWTGQFVDEIVADATDAICEEVKRRNVHCDDERLKMFVPYTLSGARANFEAEWDRFDKRLMRNGIAKLAGSDTQFVLSLLYK
jgi:hypothetical protein